MYSMVTLKRYNSQKQILKCILYEQGDTYVILHEWEGSTGEYSVSIGPTVGRANTEAEN